jgi:hypothetical protein
MLPLGQTMIDSFRFIGNNTNNYTICRINLCRVSS